jgi:hypothetical protein
MLMKQLGYKHCQWNLINSVSCLHKYKTRQKLSVVYGNNKTYLQGIVIIMARC